MRVKNAVYTRQRKKRIFRLAKGYYASKRNRWRMAVQQVEKSLAYSYSGRRDKKANFRKLWIVRLNAAVREEGISYNNFVSCLKKANIIINRKMLAEVAVKDALVFKNLIQIIKPKL
ncbi:MAG: 50S ribosomal protein L20 [Endomicrobium sp.]|jgi:large subunit ribosomal protein L20|nr:50S ribosomal protein L20 [Endomicrobium sp.]